LRSKIELSVRFLFRLARLRFLAQPSPNVLERMAGFVFQLLLWGTWISEALFKLSIEARESLDSGGFFASSFHDSLTASCQATLSPATAQVSPHICGAGRLQLLILVLTPTAKLRFQNIPHSGRVPECLSRENGGAIGSPFGSSFQYSQLTGPKI